MVRRDRFLACPRMGNAHPYKRDGEPVPYNIAPTWVNLPLEGKVSPQVTDEVLPEANPGERSGSPTVWNSRGIRRRLPHRGSCRAAWRRD